MTLEPHEQVAQQFMAHKGYGNVEPFEVARLEGGEPCWYFMYHLPEGILEIEVFWDGQEWDCLVTTFSLD